VRLEKPGETVETKRFFVLVGLFEIVIEGRGTWAAARLPHDRPSVWRE
jgi:hypothetical protein